MYGPPGFVYIYLIYGMYFCLNIVTDRERYPAAVLIRAVEPVVDGKPSESASRRVRNKSASGPGKVCQYFKIDRQLNGENICGQRLWIEDRGVKFAQKEIVRAKRIGVDYAGKYKDKLWRFYVKGSPFVSKR